MRGLWRFRKLRDEWGPRWRLWRAHRRVAGFPRIKHKRPHGLQSELIVSLTSYPPRFPTLSLTLKSLLDQGVRPDRTILWIAEHEMIELPPAVLELRNAGLEIRACLDLKSYKKVVPALEEFPNATIVTADDDLYFDSNWLESLLREARAHPDCVIAARCHLALLDSAGHVQPYLEWDLETSEVLDGPSGALLFPTTGAGVLFPPDSLHQACIDKEKFEELSPDADDLWFFWMIKMRGTRLRRIRKHRKILCWKGSQELALFHSNLTGGNNDLQARRLEGFFGKIGDFLPFRQFEEQNH